jgi:hypothetical protein
MSHELIRNPILEFPDNLNQRAPRAEVPRPRKRVALHLAATAPSSVPTRKIPVDTNETGSAFIVGLGFRSVMYDAITRPEIAPL